MSELQALCDDEKIRIYSKYGEAPARADWPDAHPYKCVLRRGNKQLTTVFYMGSAHTQEPTAADVLYSLILDTSAAEEFDDWIDFADEFGYLDRCRDPYDRQVQPKITDQVRKAREVFRACKKLAPRVRNFLGDDFDKFAEAEH